VKDSDRRFTPPWLVDVARAALGGAIDLDPCTEPGNHTRAEQFFTSYGDGLARSWSCAGPHAACWVNPPFSDLRSWVEKSVREASRGRRVLMLTPIDSTTRWFSDLSAAASLAAMLRKRLAFGFPAEHANPPKSAAKNACMLWYLGPIEHLVLDALRPHAHMYVPGEVR
jgi:phage N-6-adenine-methyltransferase